MIFGCVFFFVGGGFSSLTSSQCLEGGFRYLSFQNDFHVWQDKEKTKIFVGMLTCLHSRWVFAGGDNFLCATAGCKRIKYTNAWSGVIILFAQQALFAFSKVGFQNAFSSFPMQCLKKKQTLQF